MIVAIDNNVLISLVSDKVVKDNLETFLQQNNATLLIPTPVMAEFTAYDFNNRRRQLLSVTHSKVIAGDLDRKAAFICGQLGYDLSKDIYKDRKQKVKVDLQIVAIAIAYGADILLSEDTDVIKIAKNLNLELKVYSRKDIKLGLDLFDE